MKKRTVSNRLLRLQAVNRRLKECLFVSLSRNSVSGIATSGEECVSHDRDEKTVRSLKDVIRLMENTTSGGKRIKNADYLGGRFNMSFRLLSAVFFRSTGITLTDYLLQERIDRVKVMLCDGDKTLTEISYEFDYSSVGHLSRQFKLITGVTPTEYVHQRKLIKIAAK